MSDHIHCSQCGAPAGWEQDGEVALRAMERARKLARFVVALWEDHIFDHSSDVPQDAGSRLGVVELRQVKPGSQDAEEWGEDAELYYLADWVRELAGGE